MAQARLFPTGNPGEHGLSSGQLPGAQWAPSGESPAAPGLETLTDREALVVPLTPHPLSLHSPSAIYSPQLAPKFWSPASSRKCVSSLNATMSWQDQALEGRPLV